MRYKKTEWEIKMRRGSRQQKLEMKSIGMRTIDNGQEKILKEIIFKRTFWILDIPLTIDLCL